MNIGHTTEFAHAQSSAGNAPVPEWRAQLPAWAASVALHVVLLMLLGLMQWEQHVELQMTLELQAIGQVADETSPRELDQPHRNALDANDAPNAAAGAAASDPLANTLKSISADMNSLASESAGASAQSMQSILGTQPTFADMGSDLGGLAGGGQGAGGEVSFFGVDARAESVLFVLDLSPSMKDKSGFAGQEQKTKRDLLIEELRRTLDKMPDDMRFSILVFASQTDAWSETPALRKEAWRDALFWLDADHPIDDGTNISAALSRALRLANLPDGPDGTQKRFDTIYLMTDGRSNKGLPRDELQSYIRKMNSTQSVRIHTIGLGRDVDVDLLRAIANDNGGEAALRR